MVFRLMMLARKTGGNSLDQTAGPKSSKGLGSSNVKPWLALPVRSLSPLWFSPVTGWRKVFFGLLSQGQAGQA
jgi:hypothetical protein